LLTPLTEYRDASNPIPLIVKVFLLRC
jgi:hypothetical protein